MAGGKAATCLRDDSLLFFSASLPVPEVAAALVQSPSRPFRGGKSAPAVSSSPPSIWSNNQCHYCRVIAVGNEDIFTRLPRLSLIRKIAGCLYYSASLWHFSVASRVLGLQWNADGHRAKMGSTGLSGVFVLPCFQLGCWERGGGRETERRNANAQDCVFDVDVDCRGEWHGFFVDQAGVLQKGDEIERKGRKKGGPWSDAWDATVRGTKKDIIITSRSNFHFIFRTLIFLLFYFYWIMILDKSLRCGCVDGMSLYFTSHLLFPGSVLLSPPLVHSLAVFCFG